MADTIDPNLAVVLNNNTRDKPQARRDQLIPEDISHISGRILTSIDKPDYSVARPEAIVVKSFNSSKPKVGSIPWTKRYNLGEDTELKPFVQCMVVVPDGQNIFTPMPSSITNVEGDDHDYISMTTLAYTDNIEFINNLDRGARVQIEYIDGIAEARIVAIVSKAIVPEPDGSSNQQNTGTNMGDYKNNSTGDGTQRKSNLPSIPDGKCGDRSSAYPLEDCKRASLDSNGEVVTLHPVYWGKINDLLNKIKAETGTVIPIGETIRTKQQQFDARKARCPAALEKLGEEKFKTEPWPVLLQNGPCLDVTPVGAVYGPGQSNHIKGLAVDFKMDKWCPSSNKNAKQYAKCRATSQVFNLLNKYASGYAVINLESEPWHWSSNGN
jgi:hypothetical protein